jgi:hypothetical protein
MQHPNGVAVVATHLAVTDRRALSQAWYSALHLAQRGEPACRRAPIAAPASPGAGHAERRGASPREIPAGTPPSVRNPRSATISPRDAGRAPVPERRAPQTELARRIENAVARRRAFEGSAAFAVRAGGERVHVLVRCGGARTRIVAVCSPRLRELVERALAHARFALAGRGVRAEVA